jgi:hypothetical protein
MKFPKPGSASSFVEVCGHELTSLRGQVLFFARLPSNVRAWPAPSASNSKVRCIT